MSKMEKGERRFYTHPDDRGKHCRNMEVDGKIALTPKTTNLHCSPDNRVDHRILEKIAEDVKRWYNIEFKGNCGTLTTYYTEDIFHGLDLHDVNAIGEYILPKANYIVYGFDIGADYDVYEDCFVFTRQQFLDALFGYTSPMVKHNYKKGGYCLNVQEYKTSPNKREPYWVNACLDMPTYHDWLVEIGRLQEQE